MVLQNDVYKMGAIVFKPKQTQNTTKTGLVRENMDIFHQLYY